MSTEELGERIARMTAEADKKDAQVNRRRKNDHQL
jgi:ATP-dependent Lhr-like helicase